MYLRLYRAVSSLTVYASLTLAVFVVLGVLEPMVVSPPLPVPEGYVIHSRALSPYTSLTSLSVYAAARVICGGDAHAYILFIGALNDKPVAVLGSRGVDDDVVVVPVNIARAVGVRGGRVLLSYPGTGRYLSLRPVVAGETGGFVVISERNAAWLRAVPKGYTSIVVAGCGGAALLGGRGRVVFPEDTVIVDNYTGDYTLLRGGRGYGVRPGMYIAYTRSAGGRIVVLGSRGVVDEISVSRLVVYPPAPLPLRIAVELNGSTVFVNESFSKPIVIEDPPSPVNVTVMYGGFVYTYYYRGGLALLHIPYPGDLSLYRGEAYMVFYGGGLVVPPLANGSFLLSGREKYIVWGPGGLSGYRPSPRRPVSSRIYESLLRNYNVVIEAPSSYSVLRRAGLVLPVIILYTVTIILLAAVTAALSVSGMLEVDERAVMDTVILHRLGMPIGRAVAVFAAWGLAVRAVSVAAAYLLSMMVFSLYPGLFSVPLAYPEPGVSWLSLGIVSMYHVASMVLGVFRVARRSLGGYG